MKLRDARQADDKREKNPEAVHGGSFAKSGRASGNCGGEAGMSNDHSI
jgi:hypothetical protein